MLSSPCAGMGMGTHLRPLSGDPDVLAGRQPAALDFGGTFAGVAVAAVLQLLVLIHADHLAVPRCLPARLHALFARNNGSCNPRGTSANKSASAERASPPPSSPSERMALCPMLASLVGITLGGKFETRALLWQALREHPLTNCSHPLEVPSQTADVGREEKPKQQVLGWGRCGIQPRWDREMQGWAYRVRGWGKGARKGPTPFISAPSKYSCLDNDNPAILLPKYTPSHPWLVRGEPLARSLLAGEQQRSAPAHLCNRGA